MGLLQKIIGANFPTTFPKIQKDPIIPEAGVSICYDLKNIECWPTQTAPLDSGPAPLNLAIGNNAAWGNSANADLIGFSGGGLDFLSASDTYVNLGAYQPSGNHLFIVWAYLRDAAAGLMGQAQSTSGVQSGDDQNCWVFQITSSEVRFRIFDSGVGSFGTNVTLSTLAAAQNRVTQFAVYVDFTNQKIQGFLDGVYVAETAITYGNFRSTTHTIGVGSWRGNLQAQGNWDGKWHRAYIENIATSGRNAADVVSADYEFFKNRYA